MEIKSISQKEYLLPLSEPYFTESEVLADVVGDNQVELFFQDAITLSSNETLSPNFELTYTRGYEVKQFPQELKEQDIQQLSPEQTDEVNNTSINITAHLAIPFQEINIPPLQDQRSQHLVEIIDIFSAYFPESAEELQEIKASLNNFHEVSQQEQQQCIQSLFSTLTRLGNPEMGLLLTLFPQTQYQRTITEQFLASSGSPPSCDKCCDIPSDAVPITLLHNTPYALAEEKRYSNHAKQAHPHGPFQHENKLWLMAMACVHEPSHLTMQRMLGNTSFGGDYEQYMEVVRERLPKEIEHRNKERENNREQFTMNTVTDIFAKTILASAQEGVILTPDQQEATNTILNPEKMGWLPYHPKQNSTQKEYTYNQNTENAIKNALQKQRTVLPNTDEQLLITALAQSHGHTFTVEQQNEFTTNIRKNTINPLEEVQRLVELEAITADDIRAYDAFVTTLLSYAMTIESRQQEYVLTAEEQKIMEAVTYIRKERQLFFANYLTSQDSLYALLPEVAARLGEHKAGVHGNLTAQGGMDLCKDHSSQLQAEFTEALEAVQEVLDSNMIDPSASENIGDSMNQMDSIDQSVVMFMPTPPSYYAFSDIDSGLNSYGSLQGFSNSSVGNGFLLSLSTSTFSFSFPRFDFGNWMSMSSPPSYPSRRSVAPRFDVSPYTSTESSHGEVIVVDDNDSIFLSSTRDESTIQISQVVKDVDIYPHNQRLESTAVSYQTTTEKEQLIRNGHDVKEKPVGRRKKPKKAASKPELLVTNSQIGSFNGDNSVTYPVVSPAEISTDALTSRLRDKPTVTSSSSNSQFSFISEAHEEQAIATYFSPYIAPTFENTQTQTISISETAVITTSGDSKPPFTPQLLSPTLEQQNSFTAPLAKVEVTIGESETFLAALEHIDKRVGQGIQEQIQEHILEVNESVHQQSGQKQISNQEVQQTVSATETQSAEQVIQDQEQIQEIGTHEKSKQQESVISTQQQIQNTSQVQITQTTQQEILEEQPAGTKHTRSKTKHQSGSLSLALEANTSTTFDPSNTYAASQMLQKAIETIFPTDKGQRKRKCKAIIRALKPRNTPFEVTTDYLENYVSSHFNNPPAVVCAGWKRGKNAHGKRSMAFVIVGADTAKDARAKFKAA